MSKRILHIFIFLLFILSINNTSLGKSFNSLNVDNEQSNVNNKTDIYDATNDVKESFGISDFVKEAKEYSGDFFEDIDIGKMLDSSISGKIDNKTIVQKIINIFGKEIVSSIKVLVSILAIVLIHSVLKTVSDNLESSDISKIVYYVQYILIVTLVMKNFSEIIASITDTINNLVGFMNSLIPLLIVLTTYTGSIVTSGVVEPILLVIIEVIGNFIVKLILPTISIITALIIISKISDRIQISKLTSFLKSSIVWVLGIVLTVFVGVLSLEGTLTSSIDGITAKTAKAAVSSLIPVVGKILGDSVDSVLGCGLVLKNALGVFGVVLIIGICIGPMIKLSILSIIYSISSAIVEPMADEKIVKLLSEFSSVFKILLAILASVSVLLIIGTTLVIKISNAGMMYR